MVLISHIIQLSTLVPVFTPVGYGLGWSTKSMVPDVEQKQPNKLEIKWKLNAVYWLMR